MRLYLFLVCVATIALPLVGHCGYPSDLIETVPNAYINWTKGLIIVKGEFAPPSRIAAGQDRARLAQKARREAARNAVDALGQIRVDGNRRVVDIMATDAAVFDKLEEMAAAAPVLAKLFLPDDSVLISIQMHLLGGFSQLVLPPEIKQVQTVISMGEDPYDSLDPKIGSDERTETVNDPDVYSGLVVDARGIGAQPALVPSLIDEEGREVYGPAYVSREFAVQQGICAYMRSLDKIPEARTGSRPLIVKGLRTALQRRCDIVISNADAAKLRASSTHLGFLRKCRVVIVFE